MVIGPDGISACATEMILTVTKLNVPQAVRYRSVKLPRALEHQPVGAGPLYQDRTPVVRAAAAACAPPPVSMTARTSTEPAVAAGSIAAKCSAWSKSAQSTRV